MKPVGWIDEVICDLIGESKKGGMHKLADVLQETRVVARQENSTLRDALPSECENLRGRKAGKYFN